MSRGSISSGFRRLISSCPAVDGTPRYGCGYRPNGQCLAAALATLNDVTRKVLTIEDPAEYEIDGISQSRSGPCRLIAREVALVPNPNVREGL
jgi:hypothetical protein